MEQPLHSVQGSGGAVGECWQRLKKTACTLGLIASFPLSANPQAPADTYTRAKQAFAGHNYQLAAQLFAEVAATERTAATPPHPDALLLQAQSLINLVQFPAADAALRAFTQQQPRSAQGFYLLGYVLQRENHPADSLQIFTKAAALAPPTPNDLKLVALDYLLLNDYPDAIRWLTRALHDDPQNAEAWYDLGRAHMHGGDFAAAVNAFQRSLALDPHQPKALDNLGLCFEAQNRNDDALRTYRAAIAENDHAPHPSEQPLLNAGALLNTRSGFAEAAPLLERAVALAPGNAHGWEELARAYTGLHDLPKARTAMERAVALDGTNPRLHFQLGRLYRDAGLTQQAQQEFRRSSELYGTHSAEPSSDTAR